MRKITPVEITHSSQPEVLFDGEGARLAAEAQESGEPVVIVGLPGAWRVARMMRGAVVSVATVVRAELPVEASPAPVVDEVPEGPPPWAPRETSAAQATRLLDHLKGAGRRTSRDS